MTKRERIQAVIHGKPADRIPVSLGGITQRSTISLTSSPRPSSATIAFTISILSK